MVEDYVAKSANLKKLFAGVDIKALSLMLRRQEPRAARVAREMSDEELFEKMTHQDESRMELDVDEESDMDAGDEMSESE